MQLVHASPDPVFTTIDVYVNEVLVIDNMTFREAQQLNIPAFDSVELGIALGVSTGPEDILYTRNLRLISGTAYEAFTTGFIQPDQFEANPDGTQTDFNIVTITRSVSVSTQNQNSIVYRILNLIPDGPQAAVSLVDTAKQFRSANLVDALGYLSIAPGISSYSVRPDTLFNKKQLELYSAADDEFMAAFAGPFLSLRGSPQTFVLTGIFNAEANQEELAMFSVDGATGNVISFISVEEGIGIEELENIVSGMGIYPNPATTYAQLQYTLEAGADVNISIYNTNGQLVKQLQSQHQPAGSVNTILPVSELQSGLYHVAVTAGKQVVNQKLLVK